MSSSTYDPVPKSPLHDYQYSDGDTNPNTDDAGKRPIIHRLQEYSTKYSWTLVLLLTLLLTWSLFLRPTQYLLPSQRPITSHCGNNATEAKALGCEFDLLAAVWAPAHCIDYPSLNEYRVWVNDPARKQGAFPYFKDRAGTQRFRDEKELSEYGDEDLVWTTWEEHRWHCAMLMRRWHRAYLGIGKPDSRLGTLEHTIHCSKAVEQGLKNHSDAGIIATKFYVSYESC